MRQAATFGGPDHGTGRDQKISITGSSGLTEDEVERLRKDAEAHATEDQKRREAVESKNTRPLPYIFDQAIA